MESHTTIDWPNGLDRTPPRERERTSKFSASVGATTKQLAGELDRMDVDRYRASIGNSHTKSNSLPRHNANPDDPGFVLRWTVDGTDHAVACDHYTDLSDNLRAVYKWVNETRLRGQRPVATAQDAFAAAALPSGDDDAIAVAPGTPGPEPHEILEVAPDAGDGIVEAAARSKKAAAHPDSGDNSPWSIDEVEHAREAMLDE